MKHQYDLSKENFYDYAPILKIVMQDYDKYLNFFRAARNKANKDWDLYLKRKSYEIFTQEFLYTMTINFTDREKYTAWMNLPIDIRYDLGVKMLEKNVDFPPIIISEESISTVKGLFWEIPIEHIIFLLEIQEIDLEENKVLFNQHSFLNELFYELFVNKDNKKLDNNTLHALEKFPEIFNKYKNPYSKENLWEIITEYKKVWLENEYFWADRNTLVSAMGSILSHNPDFFEWKNKKN